MKFHIGTVGEIRIAGEPLEVAGVGDAFKRSPAAASRRF
jgi:hypothetical protein